MTLIRELRKGDVVSAKIHDTLETQGCVVGTCGYGCCIQLELANQHPNITLKDEYLTRWLIGPISSDWRVEVHHILKRDHYDRCPQCKRLMCGFDNEVRQ